jgi:hypothetical protein
MSKRFFLNQFLLFIFFHTSLFFLPLTHSSASVLAVSMGEMLENSALIFEGKVLSINPRGRPNAKLPHTCVKFQVVEVIKGVHPGNTIDLCFLGGQSGELTMTVPEMQYPQPGENGVYFVESPASNQVHPFYGWQQGHFLIRHDPASATNRVTAADGSPVTGLSLTTPGQRGLSRGVAKGVTVTDPKQLGKAVTVEEFKQEIRKMLGK